MSTYSLYSKKLSKITKQEIRDIEFGLKLALAAVKPIELDIDARLIPGVCSSSFRYEISVKIVSSSFAEVVRAKIIHYSSYQTSLTLKRLIFDACNRQHSSQNDTPPLN